MDALCEGALAADDLSGLFDERFPLEGDARVVGDYDLYAFIFRGDKLAFAEKVSECIGNALSELERQGKSYQRDRTEARLRRDPRVALAFDFFRKRLANASVVRVASTSGLSYSNSLHAFAYALEGRDGRGLARFVIPPGDSSVDFDAGDNLTAGKAKRATCWQEWHEDQECGVKLSGMPDKLKDLLDGRNGKEDVRLRWRWRGLPAPSRASYFWSSMAGPPYQYGFASTTVWVPKDLALEFIDQDGNVLWVAR